MRPSKELENLSKSIFEWLTIQMFNWHYRFCSVVRCHLKANGALYTQNWILKIIFYVATAATHLSEAMVLTMLRQ